MKQIGLKKKYSDVNKKLKLWYNKNMTKLMRYLVGGAVRDRLLHKEVADYDYATPSSKDEIVEYAKSNGFDWYIVNDDYNTVAVKENDIWKEITTFRRDVDPDGRQTNHEYTGSIFEDLSRRDFTINAIAYNEDSGSYIDPYNGRSDLNEGVIKAVGSPKVRFKEDYLRIVRGIRFAATFNFDVDIETHFAMRELALETPKYVSIERVVAEVDKLFEKSDNPSKFFEMLDDVGLLAVYFPLLHRIKYHMSKVIQNPDYHPELYVWDHIKIILDNSPKDVNIRWAALTHDLGKLFYQKFDEKEHHSFHEHEKHTYLIDEFFGNLKVSNELVDYTKFIMANHMKIDNISKKTVKRLINEHGKERVEALINFAFVDCSNAPVGIKDINRFKTFYEQINAENDVVKPIVDGMFIMGKTGLKAGKQIGQLKDRCYDYQLESNETDKEKIWAAVTNGGIKWE